MQESWVSAVVADLVAAKHRGQDFDAAWDAAMFTRLPRLHELGVSRDVDVMGEPRAAEAIQWFRGVCEAAWLGALAPGGGPSRLRGLRAALESGIGSEVRVQGARKRSRAPVS